MTVYAITDTKKGRTGIALYLSSNYPKHYYVNTIDMMSRYVIHTVCGEYGLWT